MRFLLFGLLWFGLGCSPQSVPAAKVATVAPTVNKITPAPINAPPTPAWADREVEVLEMLFLLDLRASKRTRNQFS